MIFSCSLISANSSSLPLISHSPAPILLKLSHLVLISSIFCSPPSLKAAPTLTVYWVFLPLQVFKPSALFFFFSGLLLATSGLLCFHVNFKNFSFCEEWHWNFNKDCTESLSYLWWSRHFCDLMSRRKECPLLWISDDWSNASQRTGNSQESHAAWRKKKLKT